MIVETIKKINNSNVFLLIATVFLITTSCDSTISCETRTLPDRNGEIVEVPKISFSGDSVVIQRGSVETLIIYNRLGEIVIIKNIGSMVSSSKVFGSYYEFHRLGGIRTYANMSNDEFDGDVIAYHESGRVRILGEYKKGEPLYSYFYPDKDTCFSRLIIYKAGESLKDELLGEGANE